MKAIRIHTPGDISVLRYEDIPTPEPKAKEILVHIEAIGLNYIDTYVRTGFYKKELPLTLGFEAAGIVTAIGEDVKDIKILK